VYCFVSVCDTTLLQPNRTNKPVHTETEQYTYIQSPAPEDECYNIRNILSNKKTFIKWHQVGSIYSTSKMMHGPINIRFLDYSATFLYLVRVMEGKWGDFSLMTSPQHCKWKRRRHRKCQKIVAPKMHKDQHFCLCLCEKLTSAISSLVS